MLKKPEILKLDIVLIGDFNPKIYTPAWFSAYDLIGKIESEDANIEVVHQDVTIFNLDWFRLQVTRERFSIFTEQEAYFDKLIDLVVQTFTVLPHTPISAIGLNWGGHFKTDSVEEWHNLGYYLSPQAPWDNVFEDSALLRIEITEKHKLENPSKGHLGVRVQPSNTVLNGVFVNVNDHYSLQEPDKAIGCSEIISTLERNRNESGNKFKSVIENLFDNFEKREK